jgi:ATP-binding cassette subfamily F protein 3
MDEPTNHLDIRSKDILKRALIDFEGTVIMVSHDRDFMKGICNRLFEFRDGMVKEHLCDIEEFMQLRKVERLNELDLDKKVSKEIKESKKTTTTSNDAEKTNTEIEQKQIKNQLKKIEDTIAEIELKIKSSDEKLADEKQYNQLINDKVFFENYNQLKQQLEIEMQKWEELSSKLI